MQVITSKGEENVTDGYWVAHKNDMFYPVHVSESLKQYDWSEGIFGTLEDAQERAEYHNSQSKTLK